MNLQPHPAFAKWFQHFFLRAWLVTAALFAGGLILLKSGFEVIGWTLAISFGLSIIGTLGYLNYRLYNVKCPTCGRKTRTMKDSSRRYWIARCKGCDITWDLGVGTRTSGCLNSFLRDEHCTESQ